MLPNGAPSASSSSSSRRRVSKNVIRLSLQLGASSACHEVTEVIPPAQVGVRTTRADLKQQSDLLLTITTLRAAKGQPRCVRRRVWPCKCEPSHRRVTGQRPQPEVMVLPGMACHQAARHKTRLETRYLRDGWDGLNREFVWWRVSRAIASGRRRGDRADRAGLSWVGCQPLARCAAVAWRRLPLRRAVIHGREPARRACGLPNCVPSALWSSSLPVPLGLAREEHDDPRAFRHIGARPPGRWDSAGRSTHRPCSQDQ
jgi:hypothetical protein